MSLSSLKDYMKEKTYTYNKLHYNIRVLGIGYFGIFLFLYGIYKVLSGGPLYYIALIGISFYIIFETFITCANPNIVIISDKKITFKDPKHTDTYNWNEISDFRVKELPDRKQCYIRINKQHFQLLHGRYWVYCYYFTDCDELYDFILDKEAEIHPNTIKANNRRRYNELKKKSIMNQPKNNKKGK